MGSYLLRLLSTGCAPLDLVDNHIRGSHGFPLQAEAVPGDLSDLQGTGRGHLHWGGAQGTGAEVQALTAACQILPRWGADGWGAKHHPSRCLRPACLSLLQTHMTTVIRTDRGKLFLKL